MVAVSVQPRGAGIALLLTATLILAACGQKDGVHAAARGVGAAGLGGPDSELGPSGESQSAQGQTGTGAAAVQGGKAAGGANARNTGGPAGGAGGGGAATAAGSGGDATGVGNDSITIGIHAPVTGAAPFPATSFSQGKDVYFNFLNNKGGIGGRKVKVVF